MAVSLVAFVIGFLMLEAWSFTDTSATWDEPLHLTAGYLALRHGDFRADPEHPPFLRMWAALPLLVMDHVTIDAHAIDSTSPGEWVSLGQFLFAHGFLYVHNDADRLLYAARGMNALWGVLLGFLLFSWVHEWLGLRAAATALALYALEPNLFAHAGLVTTDFGVTCFFFGAMYFLWRMLQHNTRWNLIGLTLCVAFAVVSKYSGLIVLPVVAVLLVWAVATKRLSLVRGWTVLLMLMGASILAIWAMYEFRYVPSANANWIFHLQDVALDEHTTVQQRVPWLATVVTWVDTHRLLPNTFSQGLLLSQAKAQSRDAFLLGHVSTVGWWYFFPVAFAIKTPVTLIGLAIVGLAIAFRRRVGGTSLVFFAVPIVLFLGPAMFGHINIGLRHILPMYPFVVLAAALAVHDGFSSSLKWSRAATGVAVVMALLEFVSAYPHPLTFFNVLVGGPTHGFRYLADSNLDWGQDLKGLKSWMGDHEVSRLGLAYFGSADPKYYHIDYSWLPGGVPFFDQVTDIASPPRYVAISTTFYDGVYLTPPWRLFYSAFTALTPVDVIGNSIRIYDVSAGWPHARASGPEKLDAQKSLAGALRQGGWIDEAVIEYTNYLSAKPEDLDAEFGLAEALSGQDDFARAIPHYRAVLVGRPDDVATLTNLGIALAKTGHVHDALVFLRHAVSLRPGDENLQANLARASFNDDDVAGAERAARAALQTSPDDGSTRDILAASLAMQGKGNEARTEFERVLRDNPQDRVANQGLALLGP